MGYAELGHLKAQVVRGVRSPGGVIAHIGLYLVVSTILVLVNAITWAGELWFWRPLLMLGALLLLHIGLVVAAGPSSRPRMAAASIGSRWSGWLASRPGRAETDAPAAGEQVTAWLDRLRSNPGPEPVMPAPVVATMEAEPVRWAAASPYSSWPAARTDMTAAAANTATTNWSEEAPAWSASWPAPAALAPSVAIQVRADRTNGSAPHGTRGVGLAQSLPNPNSTPTWDQLEVAAASWLAQRAAEPVAETAR